MKPNEQKLIDVSKLIYPLFVKEASGGPSEISSMPGIYRHTLAGLSGELSNLRYLGIDKILLFGVPEEKTNDARKAWDKNNFLSQAISVIKQEHPDFTIFTDLCLCAYACHGHCGILKGSQPQDKNKILRDDEATLEALAKMALMHARSGADYVSPSAMVDNQVAKLRGFLDSQGYSDTGIMGYSAKFDSNFYGPFRAAADSAARFGDRSGYQLNYQDSDRALRKIEEDIIQGADIVMVKPALSYLDVIRSAREKFDKAVIAAYNVSGEYAMAKLGAAKGLWSEQAFVCETTTAIERSGADYIITYHAPSIGRWQKEKDESRINHQKYARL